LSELGRYGGPPHGPQARAAHAAEVARVYADWGATEQTGETDGQIS
jgi:hypothetical protein